MNNQEQHAMQDLTLVRLTEDRKKLVLVSDAGEKFTLPADDRLRAALRGDLARLGQLEIQMESALRPRDIQARIRAGESPESVAEAAQTTVDRIMSYANPVLAERAHIAERAQRASIRRKAGEGPARILGDTVSEQLRARNLDPDSLDWDSWRRDDGRWALVAAFRTDDHPRRAEFVFDVQGRYVVAEDDDARWLVGEQPPRRPEQPQTPLGGPRRLSAVGPQDELRLGDDAIEMVTDPDHHHDADTTEEHTVDLTQTARELRGGTTARADDLGPAGDADWMATQATDRPQAPRRQDVPAEREPAELAQPDEAEGKAEETPEPDAPEPTPKKKGKGRRASVPSWDEIMFGGGRSE
jgi:hypothetical protein